MSHLTVAVTHHACLRARERFRWNPQTLERMSIKAFESGLKRKNSKGFLKKYFDKLKECHPETHIKLYGETIFVFRDHVLITIWQLPTELRPLAKAIKLKQQKGRFEA